MLKVKIKCKNYDGENKNSCIYGDKCKFIHEKNRIIEIIDKENQSSTIEEIIFKDIIQEKHLNTYVYECKSNPNILIKMSIKD